MAGGSLREVDLYAPVKAYLESNGYQVKAEVQGCDVVAVQGDELIVVELKLGVTMPLLMQATERQKFADAVYVAIPRPKLSLSSKRWVGVCRLLRRLELGLILVRPTAKTASRVEVAFHPMPVERRKSHQTKRLVVREANLRSGDDNVGGSTRKKLVTVYREQAIQIATLLLKNGPMTPKALRACGTGEKTLSILTQNYYRWFERVERGVYQLTPTGRTELDQFAVVVERFQSISTPTM